MQLHVAEDLQVKTDSSKMSSGDLYARSLAVAVIFVNSQMRSEIFMQCSLVVCGIVSQVDGWSYKC